MKVNVHYRDGTILEYFYVEKIFQEESSVYLTYKNSVVDIIKKYKIKRIEMTEI